MYDPWCNYLHYKTINHCYNNVYNNYMTPLFNEPMFIRSGNRCVSLPNYKRIIDISQALQNSMLLYPPSMFSMKRIRDYWTGDKMRMSEICWSHSGAHVDFPNHFILEGKKSEEYERTFGLDVFFGPAQVIEVPYNKDKIDVDFLRGIGKLPKRILFKTRNSELYKEKELKKNYVYIEPEAARYIADNHVRLVGIDYFSVDQYGSTQLLTHKTLLSNEIIILEGIILRRIRQGNYMLSCFPLKVVDVEGTPCRAVLIKY